MNTLIFKEPYLIISHDLIKIVGLKEAIVLQQINYWIEKNKLSHKNFRDGFYWTYNSYERWQKNHFSFWSVRTVREIFSGLVKKELLITGVYNKLKIDRTKWYRINYLEIENLIKLNTVSNQCDEIYNT